MAMANLSKQYREVLNELKPVGSGAFDEMRQEIFGDDYSLFGRTDG
jgi:hypothetical protein